MTPIVSWQAQYLVKLGRHLSWQAHSGIAGARKFVLFPYKICRPGGKSKLSVRDFILRSWSDHARIMVKSRLLAEAIHGFLDGEVGVSLFVAGAACHEISGESRSAKCYICPARCPRYGVILWSAE